MEDIRDLSMNYGQLDDNKTIYIITNLKEDRGWNIYIKNNILVLDHKNYKQSQPPIIYLYDKVNSKDITYVNKNPFAIIFKTKDVWKFLDNKGKMNFDQKIKLNCFN